ncbi:MAG TPA: hypothetical protein PLM53_11985 [Spirochaetota bacterium]|nr:hypothetical protein [Spirochaetota bacterium]HPC39936.1 hypothetical protein [Spirochaetota bacterium]HPL17936.1 hypothetical protein [Spirochaetota bacterium]HQF10320.1 hypothetical protein [Spirochaetota bacterium]HQH97814.1 hypothetical protein [Spirochaetota bacterium]
MVIKTDVGGMPLTRAPLPRTASDAPAPRHDGETQRAATRNITERLNIERSLGDALSVAQMSQNVIQRAISISMRLKSIAATAMATGNLNTQALTEAMYDIRSAMGDYGEQVPNPVRPVNAPSANIIELPDISGTLSSVRDIAENIRKGDFNQTRQTDEVRKNLAWHLTNYRTAEDKITFMMRETATGSAPVSGIRSAELVGQIKTAMIANPDNALSIQGNINHATAVRLMV